MRNVKFYLLTLVAFSLLTSCGKDDEGSSSSPIIGVWSFSKIEITELTFNGQDLVAYLKSKGYSDAEANDFALELEVSAEDQVDFEGIQVEFKADNTFVSKQPDDTGAWSLSDDGKVLTVDGDNYNVKSLSSAQMVLEISQSTTTDEGTIKIAMELTFTK